MFARGQDLRPTIGFRKDTSCQIISMLVVLIRRCEGEGKGKGMGRGMAKGKGRGRG